MVETLEIFNTLFKSLYISDQREQHQLGYQIHCTRDNMPYLGLKGKGLLAGVTVSSGMAFILFGMPLDHGL